MPERRWGSAGKIAAVIAVAAALAAAVYFAVFQRGGPSAEEAGQLISEKNVALGYLENQKLDEAIAALEELARKLPDDPLPWRNLAVARVVALGDEGVQATPEKLQAAQAAIAEMIRHEGESSSSNWLNSHVSLAPGDNQAAMRFLDAILQTEPKSAEAWFARFRAGQLPGARGAGSETIKDLERACENRPENAWLRVEWLRTVGTDLVRLPENRAGDIAARFGDLAKQLELARAPIEPFAPIIKVHTKVDALALLEEAKAAVEASQWREAGLKMLTLANVLLPHAALDRILVQRHPLEFVAMDFQPGALKSPPADDADGVILPAFSETAMKIAVQGATDVALADFDIDNRLDIVVLVPGRVSVWSRGAAGEDWREVASADVAGGEGLLVQDLDADFDETARAVRRPEEKDKTKGPAEALRAVCPTADVDLVVYGTGGVALLENLHNPATGARTLVAIDQEQYPEGLRNVAAAAAADLEGDGDLDLALAADGKLHRWINGGDWRFLEAAVEPRPDVTQLLALDLDRDVDIDLIAASPTEAGWLENVRHGQFRWRAFSREMPELAKARAVEVVDVDGNASWDIVGATPDGLQLVTTLTPQSGNLRPKDSILAGDLQPQGLAALDLDNDGHEDLLAWSDQQAILVRSVPNENPVSRAWDLTQPLHRTAEPAKKAAYGDLDNDGDPDAIAVSATGLTQIQNDGGNKNHWIDVALQAQQIKGQQISPSGRVSPYGVGSLLELKSAGRYQARVVRGQATHFGIGKAERADVIRVLWLNGIPHNIIQPAADEFVCEPQVLNTSCPYLYAWNGERFVFVTDLLWNAPLGLQLAEGVLAPPRDWEYLKVPGELLTAKDGEYVLQITEELWEAAYFDQVRLIAVDHPAEVQIYSNEKVGGPAMAEYKIHTAVQPRSPRSARNQSGRDLLPELASADGVYAKVHDRKLRQGVVEDCYMELDLGDVAGAKQITLFLTGWVYPSATSINVALSQGGLLPPPTPPALTVPDGEGGWRKAMPFMGFPGGKTKTIAIDLTDVLNPSDPRLRIETTMEFYWDHVFFTADEPPGEVHTTELELISADLHERGCSKVVPDLQYGPEQFLYDEVSQLPKWPPMHGAFTRLGDVKELLTERDDRLLVIGAGDEVTVKFRVPDRPLPAGWKRDFLLYDAGWEKDGNVLTVLGQAVEPLPFQAMTAYPWQPDERVPDSPAYHEYLRIYQTRRQTNQFWRP
jgi:tetratricopeptide (TPR) repeat protein